MARPHPAQLAFAFPEPRFAWAMPSRSPVNEAGRAVLHALRTCFPAHVSLDALYVDLVDARFETRPHPCSGALVDHAVADFVLFDGESATCVVHSDPRPAPRGKPGRYDWLSIRWENYACGWGWDDGGACWVRHTPH